MGDVLGNCQIAHPRLHPGGSRHGVHFENAVELRQAQQHAVFQRQRAAGEPGAGTARHHRHVVLVAKPHYRLHLFHGFRQHRHQRQLVISGEAVTFVRLEVLLLVEHRVRGKDGPQPLRQVGAAQSVVDDFAVCGLHLAR